MKAELTKDGYVKITAETIIEAFALKAIYPLEGEVCSMCGGFDLKLIVDSSVLISDNQRS